MRYEKVESLLNPCIRNPCYNELPDITNQLSVPLNSCLQFLEKFSRFNELSI